LDSNFADLFLIISLNWQLYMKHLLTTFNNRRIFCTK